MRVAAVVLVTLVEQRVLLVMAAVQAVELLEQQTQVVAGVVLTGLHLEATAVLVLLLSDTLIRTQQQLQLQAHQQLLWLVDIESINGLVLVQLLFKNHGTFCKNRKRSGYASHSGRARCY
jgi:hypothetical protein